MLPTDTFLRRLVRSTPASTWHAAGHSPLSGDLSGHDQVGGFFRRTMELSGGAAARVLFQSLADSPSVSDLA
jgi:hypothetical protein